MEEKNRWQAEQETLEYLLEVIDYDQLLILHNFIFKMSVSKDKLIIDPEYINEVYSNITISHPELVYSVELLGKEWLIDRLNSLYQIFTQLDEFEKYVLLQRVTNLEIYS